MTEYSGTLDS